MLTENIYLQAETAAITTATGNTKALTQTGELDEGNNGGGNKDVFNLRPGYSGKGYLDFGSSTSGAEAAAYTLTIPAGEEGTYALHVRYSSSSSRSVRIDDGTSQQDVTFAPTADGEEEPFDNWSVEVVEVELVGGENTLVLSLFGGNGPNIDALAITNPGETADFAPRFTTLAEFEIAEGETAVGTVGAADVDEDTTDGDDSVDPVTFSIAGGADGDAFTIDATTGELALKTAADPESQPSYEVVVAATDAAGNTVTQAVAVSVTEMVPAFTAAHFEAEDGVPGEGNDTATQIRDAGNPEDNGNRPDFSGTGYVDYGNVAGDSYSYTFDDSEGGARILYVRYATNGDRPLDVLVNGTSILAEPVEATPFTNTDPDGSGPEEGFDHWEIAAFDITTTAGSNTITLSIPSPGQNAPNVDALAIAQPGEPVNFFAPEITSAAAFALDENTTEAGQVVAKDLDGDALSYALSGEDADKVSIDAEGRLTLDAAPDFEAPQDADGNNAYEVTVAVSDGVETVSQDLTISVADVDPELAAPTIDPIVLQGETGIIPAGADTFHRDQADIAAGIDETEGTPNTNKGGNAGEPLDGFGLREGYSGFGYTDFGGDGAEGDETVSWTVEVAEAGLYDLHIRFASAAATAGDRPVDVLVNGAVQHGELGFPNRDGFATWVVREPVQVALEAGPNTLSLAIPAGFSNGPNIDAVALTTVGETPAFPPANTAPSFDGAHGGDHGRRRDRGRPRDLRRHRCGRRRDRLHPLGTGRRRLHDQRGRGAELRGHSRCRGSGRRRRRQSLRGDGDRQRRRAASLPGRHRHGDRHSR